MNHQQQSNPPSTETPPVCSPLPTTLTATQPGPRVTGSPTTSLTALSSSTGQSSHSTSTRALLMPPASSPLPPTATLSPASISQGIYAHVEHVTSSTATEQRRDSQPSLSSRTAGLLTSPPQPSPPELKQGEPSGGGGGSLVAGRQHGQHTSSGGETVELALAAALGQSSLSFSQSEDNRSNRGDRSAASAHALVATTCSLHLPTNTSPLAQRIPGTLMAHGHDHTLGSQITTLTISPSTQRTQFPPNPSHSTLTCYTAGPSTTSVTTQRPQQHGCNSHFPVSQTTSMEISTPPLDYHKQVCSCAASGGSTEEQCFGHPTQSSKMTVRMSRPERPPSPPVSAAQCVDRPPPPVSAGDRVLSQTRYAASPDASIGQQRSGHVPYPHPTH